MTAIFPQKREGLDGAAGVRLPAIDAMRGIVMVLMALDHASYAFNAGRYARDAYQWYPAGAVIPTVQFMTRWFTHLCAPTFLFLAGFALALHVSKRQARGHSEGVIDGDIVKRGIFILLLDPLWMSIGFGGGIVLQVLYCIGAGLCFMVLLRRLGTCTLMILSLAILFLGEAVSLLPFWNSGGGILELIGRSMFFGGPLEVGGYVLYPVMPWLGCMLLGWICGNHILIYGRRRAPRFFLAAGLVSLGVFFVARGANQYGNMLLYRYGHSIVQWLHVSKYPPSLTFSALELGLMFLILAFLFLLCKNGQRRSFNPLYVFGRTPLFFYLLHVHMLTLAARLLGMYRSAGLVETLMATFAVLLLMYPLCRWYFSVKRSRPGSVLRYV